MFCYLDSTFCSSPACRNKCGRKLSKEQIQQAGLAGFLISYSKFCDDNGELLPTGYCNPNIEDGA